MTDRKDAKDHFTVLPENVMHTLKKYGHFYFEDFSNPMKELNWRISFSFLYLRQVTAVNIRKNSDFLLRQIQFFSMNDYAFPQPFIVKITPGHWAIILESKLKSSRL